LHARNTAVRLSTKAALFHRYFSMRNNREAKSRSVNKKAAIRTRLDCTRATQPYGFRQRRLYFTAIFNTKQPRSHKNEAALSTKMSRSVSGLIAHVQHSRTAFDKGGFISPLSFNTKKAAIRARLHCTRATKPASEQAPGWRQLR
jgi:hypothetical protein